MGSILRTFRAFSRLFVAAALLAAAACAPIPSEKYQQPARFATWTAQPPEYRLGPADEISIRMPYAQELNTAGPIGPDGRFTLPLLGTFVAAGKTPTELADYLTKALAGQVVDPKVAVQVTRYGHDRVYIGGEVRNPGSFQVDSQVGVLEQIMVAGGMLDTARSGEVVLIRRGPDGHPMLRVVDVDKFIKTGDTSQDVPVQPLDIIYVPKTSIAEVDTWVDQYINRSLPFSRSFGYSISEGTATTITR